MIRRFMRGFPHTYWKREKPDQFGAVELVCNAGKVGTMRYTQIQETTMSETGHTYCTDIALEQGVPLLGSATTGDFWILVEYGGRWESKAFEGSTIPEAVKAHLSGIQPEGQRTRILMIQQPETRQRDGLHVFVGGIAPQSPRLYEYHLRDYDEILTLDLSALADGGDDPAHRREEPLFLVCTNGKRDACCARLGPAAYRALTGTFGDAVWQSSHIGGHNKAPNLLFFPFGVEYGRATPAEAVRLAQTFADGQVVLEYLRGRVCYPLEVQAAIHYWREDTAVLDLPGPQVTAVEQTAGDTWRVALLGSAEPEPRWVSVRREESAEALPISCAGDKLKPFISFSRVG